MPSNLSGDHHEVDFGGGGDVGDGVAGHGDDVGERAGREDADVATTEELGGGPGGGAKRACGVEPGLDHGLELKVAVAEGEHPAVGGVGYLDLACGDTPLGLEDLLGIAFDLGRGVWGESPLV